MLLKCITILVMFFYHTVYKPAMKLYLFKLNTFPWWFVNVTLDSISWQVQFYNFGRFSLVSWSFIHNMLSVYMTIGWPGDTEEITDLDTTNKSNVNRDAIKYQAYDSNEDLFFSGDYVLFSIHTQKVKHVITWRHFHFDSQWLDEIYCNMYTAGHV